MDARSLRFDGLAHGVFWTSLAVARCNDQRQAAADFLVSQLSPGEVAALV